MDDTLRYALVVAVMGLAAVGAYLYWQRQKNATADEAERRRMQRKRQTENKNDKSASRPAARPAGFGRR
ncbi:MAG: hypothetical protein F9K44_07980 [Hyphomicrobiaceae bacterium]|nr:MAG: hypothetical protein F9K44_07980 [Hyphomicrobiaceae bacterium]